MSILSQKKSILKSVNYYTELLNTLSEEEFQLSPEDGSWSYSEVFSHIFQANLASLIATEKCLNGTGTLNHKNSHWIVRAILFFGRFPPGKFKAPESLASMCEKIDKEKARNLIVKFKSRLEDMATKVGKASIHMKIKHPRLGLLNAKQWFRFIEVHTLHHQKQLDRIKSTFQKSK
ncbi:MAG: DinB family protein [Daejeonella sp.]